MDVLTIPTAYQKKKKKKKKKKERKKERISEKKNEKKREREKKKGGFKFSYTSHAGVFLYGISS